MLTEQEVINAELADCHLFVEKVNSRFMILEANRRHIAGDDLNLIHEVIEVDEFIIGGLCFSMLIQHIINLMFEDEEIHELASI